MWYIPLLHWDNGKENGEYWVVHVSSIQHVLPSGSMCWPDSGVLTPQTDYCMLNQTEARRKFGLCECCTRNSANPWNCYELPRCA